MPASVATVAETAARAITGALSLLLLADAPALAAEPLAIRSDVSFGYDTNPAQSREGPELAFARYGVESARAWPLAGAEFGFIASGWYRDNEADNDSYRLSLTGDWTRATNSGAGLLKVSVAGAAYRDRLVPADERDEAAVGIRYSRVLSARHTLGLNGELRRLAYRNASLPWAGRPGAGADAGSGRGSDTGRNASTDNRHRNDTLAVRRDDDLFGVGLDLTRHWLPSVASVLSVAHARCESSMTAQTYDRDDLGLALRVTPAERWRLELGLGWSLTRYAEISRQVRREDEQHSLTFAARRALPGRRPGEGEAFCGIDWLDSVSTRAERSFQQQVIQCGLSWSFR
ncbi:hypothetical protein [Thiocystis violascens]|uniref:Outer membrane protein beta-barrel domain-containing protein n=1 Tax=Thiocystis violascens (strain ATCC 17096 / DSM 198 / 6111) TaxID=765911 RepID=I3YGY7_THIV6|nr:hypothetical protein [Thiocystis violascens]AFL76255.1 hypothetical protein Thivi_4456 [Thiocystis violascens DSM 198]